MSQIVLPDLSVPECQPVPRARPATALPVTRCGLRRRSAVLLATLALPVAAVAGLWMVQTLSTRSAHRGETFETKLVTRGPLEIKLAERGNIDSANNLTLRSLVEGGLGSTILKIVDEGTTVAAGDVVVELDSAKLRDEALAAQIRLDAAVAALKIAEADREIQVMQNESDLAAAELKLKLARMDLRKYQEADYVQKLDAVGAEILMAVENFARAKERWQFTGQLLQRGFTTTKVLDADRVAVAKTEIELAAARQKHDVLDQYTHTREIAELQANVAFREREIGRIRLRCEASLTVRERTLLARKRTHFLETQRWEKLQGQIAACTIRSPRDGLVVFANTLEGGRSSPTPLIYEGATVRERQPIVHLPDLTQMRVNARIHESKIAQLHEGQSVTVHVDAIPDETFHGIVDNVAPVPNSGSWPNIHLKEYMTAIKLTDNVKQLAELKPGMTAEVDILVDRLESVVQAPLEACVERGGRYFAWVIDDAEEPVRHEIQIGQSNETEAEVLAGLAEGDAVVLNPRRTLPDEIARLEQEVIHSAETNWKKPAPVAHPVVTPREPEPVPASAKDKDQPADDAKPQTEEPRPASPGAPEPAPVLIVASMPEPGAKAGKTASDPMDVFNRLDQNHDAQVTAAELPDPMKPVLVRLDRNGDHVIDKEEWRKGTCTVPPPAELRSETKTP